MADQGESFKLIKAGRLIDAKGGPPIERGVVLIQGSKIRVVGPEKDVLAPEGATIEVFDFPGMTVMPGMVDCHTHHNGFGDGSNGIELAKMPDEVLSLQSARNARASLFTGVTTIRENGPKNVTMFRLRDAINQGISVGPRMVLCGRPVSIIGGHMGYFGSEVTGPTEVRAMTRQLIKEGADYIKITATGGSTPTSFPLRPAFNVDELQAITAEAHKFGKLTATHCLSTQGIINSLDADVDMIIHCVYKTPDGTNNFRPEVAERLQKEEAYVNPTLHVGRARYWTLEYKKEREGLTNQEQAVLDTERRNFETSIENSARMIEAGVNIITGSDSSWGDYQLGNTAYEAECLVMAGYSTMQSVLSVTNEAAKALGVDDIVGTLEPGKEADVIVVNGNPAEKIEDLWKIAEVFSAGRRIDRGSEDSLASVQQPRPRSY